MKTKTLSVRAITAFVVLDRDSSTWSAVLEKAVCFNAALARKFAAAGYAVQTLRIITNPFGEYIDTSEVEKTLAELKIIQSLIGALEKSAAGGMRIRASIGAATTLEELALVPSLIRAAGDLANCCVNIPADKCGAPDAKWTEAAARVCTEIGATTERGEGNFNFTINFNGPHLCPYFPAGYNTRADDESFAIGIEYPDLLVETLEKQRDQDARSRANGSIVRSVETRGEDWAQAAKQMRQAVEKHLAVLAAISREAADESGRRFAGADSSPAPSKNAQSMARVVELLGVPYFGASGTIEACEMLTRMIKGLTVEGGCPLIGFSGLMFACLEDEGLAAAAANGHYDIRAMLTYSAICGIGLDTVPVPGDTPPEKLAALVRDCGAMAFRLDKPLTARLFPAPGLAAGDLTRFDSPDLCNCAVFVVP